MTQKETYAPHHCLNESSYKVAKMNLVIGMKVPNVSGAWCFVAMLPRYMGMKVPNVSGAWCFVAMLPRYMGMIAFLYG